MRWGDRQSGAGERKSGGCLGEIEPDRLVFGQSWVPPHRRMLGVYVTPRIPKSIVISIEKIRKCRRDDLERLGVRFARNNGNRTHQTNLEHPS